MDHQADRCPWPDRDGRLDLEIARGELAARLRDALLGRLAQRGDEVAVFAELELGPDPKQGRNRNALQQRPGVEINLRRAPTLLAARPGHMRRPPGRAVTRISKLKQGSHASTLQPLQRGPNLRRSAQHAMRIKSALDQFRSRPCPDRASTERAAADASSPRHVARQRASDQRTPGLGPCASDNSFKHHRARSERGTVTTMFSAGTPNIGSRLRCEHDARAQPGFGNGLASVRSGEAATSGVVSKSKPPEASYCSNGNGTPGEVADRADNRALTLRKGHGFWTIA